LSLAPLHIVAVCVNRIGTEHRLMADYDNWSDSNLARTITEQEAISMAKDFMTAAKEYMNEKYGIWL